MRPLVLQLVLIFLVCWLLGCRVKVPATPVAAPVQNSDHEDAGLGPGHDYIDLEPGWLVRVVIPLSTSGVMTDTAISPAVVKHVAGETLTASAPKDFAGFETDVYNVSARGGGGVRVTFQTAEVSKGGQTVPQTKPVIDLFHLPRAVRYVRLLFLARVSKADHNMALLASSKFSRLDELTRAVQQNQSACVSSAEAMCAWVPLGIAVRPEAQ
jgi:hypothetical protein